VKTVQFAAYQFRFAEFAVDNAIDIRMLTRGAKAAVIVNTTIPHIEFEEALALVLEMEPIEQRLTWG
jgi:hypothetical protein